MIAFDLKKPKIRGVFGPGREMEFRGSNLEFIDKEAKRSEENQAARM